MLRLVASSFPCASFRGVFSPQLAMPTVVAPQVTPVPTAMAAARDYAHWYSGRQRKHRIARDLKFHPRYQRDKHMVNSTSKRLHYRSNRWNYRLAYRDTP